MKNKKGFALIELLVVILIIGVLAGIALPQYQRAKEKAIMQEGMKLARLIAEANRRYHLFNNEYSTDVRDLDLGFSGDVVVYGGRNRIDIDDNFVVSAKGTEDFEIAVVQRKPVYEKYYIRILTTNLNRFDCGTYSNATKIQQELCDKLNQQGHL